MLMIALPKSVTLVRADSLAADACGRFPAVALIEIMAQTIGIYAGRLQRLAGEPPVVGLLLGTRRMSLPISFSSRRATNFSAEFKEI